MPTLDKSNFNIVCATLGGFITLFGLISYLCKERLFLSEALISLIAGVTFSPHATGLINPLAYAGGSQQNLDDITHYFSRLVLGVQLVIAGIQLPSKYLLKEWRPLAWLLGPGMTGMWLCSSLLIWGLVPNLTFLHALAVGACVTPTDPVLSNSIVKGRFADKNIPKPLQRIIIAESGANDGLGYPFLFLALYLIQYTGDNGQGQSGDARTAIGMWFGETWGYEILLGAVYGAAVGYLAKELLHWAEEHKYVDRESFLVFAITLALFITGTCGMIGSDDVLACFIAGNVFTIDDWFRLETLDDSLQPTIDMLLNLSVFMWFGAVCPWASFANNSVIPIYRLIPLGILILLFRRLPVVLAMHHQIPQIEHLSQTFFVGFFGPIGVGAVFYLFVSIEFLQGLTVDGVVREDAVYLQEVMRVVIWFLAICSIVVHGLSVPLGKLGYHLPRTISSRMESHDTQNSEPFQVGEQLSNGLQSPRGVQLRPVPHPRGKRGEPVRQVFRIGGSVIPGGGRSTPGTPILKNPPVSLGLGKGEALSPRPQSPALPSDSGPSSTSVVGSAAEAPVVEGAVEGNDGGTDSGPSSQSTGHPLGHSQPALNTASGAIDDKEQPE